MPDSLKELRHLLPLVGVLIQCLDKNMAPIPSTTASGFVRRDQGQLWLYTCWHVATGMDPMDLSVGREPPSRRFLRAHFQAVEVLGPDAEAIGGMQEVTIPLYEEPETWVPLWEQDDAHVPNGDLNSLGIWVPFWHDLIRIPLPSIIQLSSLQVVDEDSLLKSEPPGVGDKCIVVGYPYGFSTSGAGQPSPVGLTRFIASSWIQGRAPRFYLEASGAPGMSGGPVFIERDGRLFLFGIYTGADFPSRAMKIEDRVSGLGRVTGLMLHFLNAVALTREPTRAISPAGVELKMISVS